MLGSVMYAPADAGLNLDNMVKVLKKQPFVVLSSIMIYVLLVGYMYLA
jgi:hypothetical protein